jgi:hypothetical protein
VLFIDPLYPVLSFYTGSWILGALGSGRLVELQRLGMSVALISGRVPVSEV